MFSITPIGTALTDRHARALTPRQAHLLSGEGTNIIALLPHRNFEVALSDLDRFSHLWVLFYFDRARGWKPKVQPPRGRQRRGVFATRAPHRPNPIGITACSLYRVEGLTLVVSALDLLHGTPIIDIKPYLAEADSIADASAGWLDDDGLLPVRLSSLAAEQCQEWEIRGLGGVAAHLISTLQEVQWTHPWRRVTEREPGCLEAAFQYWRCRAERRDEELYITGFYEVESEKGARETS